MLLQRPDSCLCFGNDIIISQCVNTPGNIQQPSARINAFICLYGIFTNTIIMLAHSCCQFFIVRSGKDPLFVTVYPFSILCQFKQRKRVGCITVSYTLTARSPIDQPLKRLAAILIYVGNNTLKRAVIHIVWLFFEHILSQHEQSICLFLRDRFIGQHNEINIAPSRSEVIKYRTSVQPCAVYSSLQY